MIVIKTKMIDLHHRAQDSTEKKWTTGEHECHLFRIFFTQDWLFFADAKVLLSVHRPSVRKVHFLHEVVQRSVHTF